VRILVWDVHLHRSDGYNPRWLVVGGDEDDAAGRKDFLVSWAYANTVPSFDLPASIVGPSTYYYELDRDIIINFLSGLSGWAGYNGFPGFSELDLDGSSFLERLTTESPRSTWSNGH
jgi:hypothetical protein